MPPAPTDSLCRMARYLHTMVRVTDPARSREFYEALGFTFSREMDIVRNGELEATNYFFSVGDTPDVLELTFNHDGRSYELGTAYGHVAIEVPDVKKACERVKSQGGKITREPGPVKGGTTVIAFAEDPDGYKIEFIERKPR